MSEFDAFKIKSPEELLSWVYKKYGSKAAIASSFGVEDVALIHMAVNIFPKARVFTLDTGRLPNETYEVMEAIRKKYGIPIEVYFPDATRVETLVRAKGLFSFRESISNRKECCGIRKVEPLGRALKACEAWITGLRREQAVTRGEIQKLENDADHGGILKVNPLVDWTEKETWDYVRKHGVPYNKLHDLGYRSIGCDPCTRAVGPNEDFRAGRWWWENPEQKECGLHEKKKSEE